MPSVLAEVTGDGTDTCGAALAGVAASAEPGRVAAGGTRDETGQGGKGAEVQAASRARLASSVSRCKGLPVDRTREPKVGLKRSIAVILFMGIQAGQGLFAAVMRAV